MKKKKILAVAGLTALVVGLVGCQKKRSIVLENKLEPEDLDQDEAPE